MFPHLINALSDYVIHCFFHFITKKNDVLQ